MKIIEEIDLKALIESETLETFSKDNKIRSPFNPGDKTPSFAIYFDSNANKMKFKDFSTGAVGDCLDFIMQYKNYDYKQAREYLGLEVDKTPNEIEVDKVTEFVKWQLNTSKKGYELLGIFPFVDANNKPIYYKVKLLKPDGKKETPYYYVEGGKVINKRGSEEVAYNYYNVLQSNREKDIIVIVEGEKDVNTINRIIRSRHYVATSIKNVKDISFLEDRRIYIIGDTGKAGDKYVNEIKDKLFIASREFRIIKLPGLKLLGDNKDVTDWLESGHTKEDLLKAFNSSLDLKNRLELQQDYKGIYKSIGKKNENGEIEYKRSYIADFKVIEAIRVNLIDEEKEGVKLILKSNSGKKYERIGRSSVMNDLRTFKNFLGTIDLNFLGEGKDLAIFCKWINDYFAIDNEIIYSGVKFLKDENNSIVLVTPNGAITKNGVDKLIKSDKTNNIDVVDIEPINADELREVLKYLFNFAGPDKVYMIVGTVINNLMVQQCIDLGIPLHHLLIVGESGSGKSTVLKNVIAQLLNYPVKDIKSIGLTTAFALTKDLSIGNYTTLYDEFKPSMMGNDKKQKISDTLRNLYERTVVVRGDKSLNTKEYQFTRPIVIAGEESYPNAEKANIERSAIVYMSVSDQNPETSEAIDWLTENSELLNKLGRALINKCICMTPKDYLSIRERLKGNLSSLKKRPLTTALNASSGIEILNMVIDDLGVTDCRIEGFEDCITYNIEQEVLEDGEETHSIVEQMLLLFDNMIADNRVRNYDEIVKVKDNALYIKNSEMLNLIHEYCFKTGAAELIPLKLRDFNKQASKSKYLIKDAKKQIPVMNGYTNIWKNIWFDGYNLKKIRELGCFNIAPLSEFEKRLEESYKANQDYEEIKQGGFDF